MQGHCEPWRRCSPRRSYFHGQQSKSASKKMGYWESWSDAKYSSRSCREVLIPGNHRILEMAKASPCKSRFIPNPRERWFDQMWEVLRLPHCASRSEWTAVEWIQRNLSFHRRSDPTGVGWTATISSGRGLFEYAYARQRIWKWKDNECLPIFSRCVEWTPKTES